MTSWSTSETWEANALGEFELRKAGYVGNNSFGELESSKAGK
jgi:hypothetical protein